MDIYGEINALETSMLLLVYISWVVKRNINKGFRKYSWRADIFGFASVMNASENTATVNSPTFTPFFQKAAYVFCTLSKRPITAKMRQPTRK